MRFEVLYANGVQHEVELQGTTATLGRDPSCDLVLNDAKCSRRHAVIEAGPQGMSIRDNGSANGIFLNGRKVERSPLTEGDIVRLGETVLKVLPENITGTLMMGPDEMADFQETEPIARPGGLGGATPAGPPPKPAPPPQPPPKAAPPAVTAPSPRPEPPKPEPPRPAPPEAKAAPPPRPAPPPPPAPPAATATSPRAPRPPVAGPAWRPRPVASDERPLTVTALAVLWLASAAFVLAAAVGAVSFGQLEGRFAAGAGLLGLLGVALSLAVAWGLWKSAPWARMAQLALSGVGVLLCPLTLASLATLAYMLREDAKRHFSGEETEEEPRGQTEVAFTLAIVGTLLLGLLVSAIALIVAWPYVRKLLSPE
ncbi:MAG: FHA domain-containing protein [Vicinamibacteria bacterium]